MAGARDEENRRLVAAHQAGDGDAFAALCRANAGWLHRQAQTRAWLCRRRWDDHLIDDFHAAAEFGLWRAADRFDLARPVTFLTYAAWLIRRALIDEAEGAFLIRVPRRANPAGGMRGAARFPLDSERAIGCRSVGTLLDDELGVAGGADCPVERAEEVAHVLGRLAALPPPLREAVELHHLKGRTIQGAAAEMGCNAKTARKRISAAIGMIREREGAE